MKRIVICTTLAALAVIWLACDSDSPTNSPNQPPDLSQTPRENYEAELAAAVLSGQVMAPQYLYERVLSDLEKIRSEYGDSLPVGRIGYWPHWIASAIAARIDSAVLADSASGARRMLDSLNAVYRCTSESQPHGTWWYLEFQGVLNPFALTRIYSSVPGMKVICPMINGPGDWSLFSLCWSRRGEIQYFFRYGFGDCPSGCIYSIYFYFSTSYRGVTYHGYYPHDLRNPEPKPEWFDSASRAIEPVLFPDCWEADSV